MSDNKKPENKEPNGSEDHREAKFNILAQFIKDLSFESPNTPQSLRGPGEDPNLRVNFTVGAEKVEEDVFEVVINFEADATNKAGAIYKLEMIYGGLFQLQNLPEHIRHPVLFVNCPTLLFPFLRRIVADLTREGGFPPLMLDPIDFGALYQQNLDQAKAESEKSEGEKADS